MHCACSLSADRRIQRVREVVRIGVKSGKRGARRRRGTLRDIKGRAIQIVLKANGPPDNVFKPSIKRTPSGRRNRPQSHPLLLAARRRRRGPQSPPLFESVLRCIAIVIAIVERVRACSLEGE